MYRFKSKRSSDHYVLFCHDPLSHLVIDASSSVKLMHTRSDFKLHFLCFFCFFFLQTIWITISATECAATLLSFKQNPSR